MYETAQRCTLAPSLLYEIGKNYGNNSTATPYITRSMQSRLMPNMFLSYKDSTEKCRFRFRNTQTSLMQDRRTARIVFLSFSAATSRLIDRIPNYVSCTRKTFHRISTSFSSPDKVRMWRAFCG